MQDIHSIGGVGTLLGGGGGSGAAGGGDRRLRLTNHHSLSHLGHHPHQALKCPRCDSLNTKFCYYNNYNLSQPRHFCKSCRRYWTRGGVLRNVPVGGGCRKSKRSPKPKPKPSTTNTASASATISPPPPQPSTLTTSNSHSSSESSSVTATANMNTNTGTAVEAVSGYSSSLNGVVGDSLGPPGLGFDPIGLMDQPGTGGPERGIFPDMGSGFTSLMSSSANEILAPFGLNSVLNHHHQEHQEQQFWNQEDQTAEVVGMQKGNGDFGLLDWQASGGVGDQGFFDLPMISGVDQGYWSQSHWSSDQDHDHSNLYLP